MEDMSQSDESQTDDNPLQMEYNIHNQAYDDEYRPAPAETAGSHIRSMPQSPFGGAKHTVTSGDVGPKGQDNFINHIHGTADAIIASLGKPEDDVIPYCRYLSGQMKRMTAMESTRLELAIQQKLFEIQEARQFAI